MAILHLNVPDQIKAAAEARVAAAGYQSLDQYIATLIESDDLSPVSDELEAELLAGLNGGPSVPITRQFLAELKDRVGKSRPVVD